jgi:hypothetical protein
MQAQIINNQRGFLSIAPLILYMDAKSYYNTNSNLILYFADFFLNESTNISERAAIKRIPASIIMIF